MLNKPGETLIETLKGQGAGLAQATPWALTTCSTIVLVLLDSDLLVEEKYADRFQAGSYIITTMAFYRLQNKPRKKNKEENKDSVIMPGAFRRHSPADRR